MMTFTPLTVLLLIAGPLVGAAIEALIVRQTQAQTPAMWRYILAATLGFGVAYWAALAGPLGGLALSCLFGWLLLAASLYDVRTFILPDGLTAAIAALGLGMLAWLQPGDWPWHLLAGLVGYAVLFVVEKASLALRGAEGIGRGDAKLLGAIGLWVGLDGLAGTLLIGSMAGLAAALIVIVFGRSKHDAPLNMALPFGPCLAFGGWVIWLHGLFYLPGV